MEASRAGTLELKVDQDVVRSSMPTAYVPRRFRIDGIEGIRPGAAIIGTPQGDGMVAIDVEWMPDIEPQAGTLLFWAESAAERHAADDTEANRRRGTRLVPQAALVRVGTVIDGRVVIEDRARELELARWLRASRADFVVERPFPHQQ
jgi:hypothetical protein